ncbi:MAG: endoribonuclease [Actinomycetota bacterium]|jgi:glyoxylase-like metal-dependent hydrolase (beta-lactamase superfamily II)/8-oxo-dGTP pyrophosphatase MutT (NUDIX family)|nr:endoribonuclease [Actinomycetota bacterium]
MNRPQSDAEPRKASTVVVVRRGPAPFEVLLTIRPKHLRFMGGAAVFPGGSQDPADRDPRWASLVTGATTDLAERVCALREAYEEVGLFLGEGPISELGPSDADDPELFLNRCLELGITLHAGDLVPAGGWVTPLGSPIRFDTRFYLAEADRAWVPEPDPSEVESWLWATPAESLDAMSRGELLMAPPTIEMLQRLAGHSSIDDAFEALSHEPLTGAGRVISARLSPLVHLVMAPNPSVMTGPGTNSYIVGTGPVAIIDPAVDDPEYLDALTRFARNVRAILVTHRHEDHVGGIAALVERYGCPVHAYGTEPAGGVDVSPLGEGDRLEVGGGSLLALYAPGHASDHLNFLLEGTKSLFAGDNILGQGTAVIAPPDGDMREYMRTLHRLRDLDLERIYPGHFRPLDGGLAVIEEYIAHREQRKSQVLDALSGGPSTVDEIVARAYTDTPQNLHPVARYQTLAMLELLEDEGRVEPAGERWRLIGVDQ